MRDRLDDPVLISSDLVMNMLLAFREIQDYNSMVKLVEDLDSVAGYSGNYQRTDHISFLYAFALNRRKASGKICKYECLELFGVLYELMPFARVCYGMT